MSFFKDVYGAFREAAGRNVGSDVPRSAKLSKDDIIPGDIDVIEITAIKGDTTFDLMSQVTEIHIFESVVSPVIFGQLQIADAINFDEDFIIDDKNTYVYMKLLTPGATKGPLEYVFKANKISDKKDNPSNGMKTYSIQLISPEAITSQQSDLQGMKLNDTAGKLIEKIMREEVKTNSTITQLNSTFPASNKKMSISTTTGIIAKNTIGAVPFPTDTKPFPGIHQIVLLTNISPEGYSLYTFFEGRDGYKFDSIEKMMVDGKKLIEQDKTDFYFFYDNLRNENKSAVKIRNILAYNQINSGDAAVSAINGVNSDVSLYNPQTGEFETKKGTPEIETLRGDWTSAQAKKEFNFVTKKSMVASSEQDRLHETIEKRTTMITRIGAFEAQILIYGDTNLQAGDVIECTFPRSLGPDDKTSSGQTSKESGKYIITHLRHMILNTDRPQHIISCNLMKAEVPRS